MTESTLSQIHVEFATFKKASVDRAPRVPPLKLSMKRTHLFSRGTAVPPEDTQTMGRPGEPTIHSNSIADMRAGIMTTLVTWRNLHAACL